MTTSMRNQRHEPDQVQLACDLHEQALAAQAEGRLRQADTLCRRSLRNLESELGPRHPDVANVLNALAIIQQDLGRYAEAETLLRRSVSIMSRMRGGDDVAHPRPILSRPGVALL